MSPPAKKTTKTMEQYLAEGTPAAESLKSAQETQLNTTDAAKALASFMKLSPKDQEDFLNKAGYELEKSLKSHKGGDGVGDGTAEKSRKSLTDAQAKKPRPNKEVDFTLRREEIEKLCAESFPEFSPELQQRFVELFEAHSVGDKTFKSQLLQLFADDPLFSAVFSEANGGEQMNEIERLAHRIGELEDAIAQVEAENSFMRHQQRQQALGEDTLFAANEERRSSKRKSLDMDNYLDPENSRLMESGETGGDPAMAKRVEYINLTTRNTDSKSPVSGLLEAWDNIKE